MTASLPQITSRLGFELLEMTLKGKKGSGCADENQDRILQRTLPGAVLMAVADGVSLCPKGTEIASYVIDTHLARDPVMENCSSPLPGRLRTYVQRLHTAFYSEFAEDPLMLESACTLSLALLENDVANCFWVGDSPVFVARHSRGRFELTQLSTPDTSGGLLIDCFGSHAPCRLKHRKVLLAVGDLLIVATDGVTHEPAAFEALLNAHGPTAKLLDTLTAHIHQADFYDDASLVMARRCV